MLLAVTACTDDHFDVVTNTESSASNTIWDNIEATAELDSVAMILQKIKVLRSETDYGTDKQTYAELLDQPNVFTAWLPINGSFNAKSYLDEIAEAEAVYAENQAAGTILQYEIQQQFAQNHLSRFNYEGRTGSFQARMMNTKLITFDKDKSTFNGVNLDATYGSIASSNGVLHVLDGVSPYAYNVYDYWANDTTMAAFYDVIEAYDKYTFSPGSSTEGGLNEEGQMVYVDSVYNYSNELLTEAMADITDEDSLYVAILPTDAAYATALEQVSSLYTYGSTYCYQWTTSTGAFTYTGTSAFRWENTIDFEYEMTAEEYGLEQTNQAILNSSFVSATSVSNFDTTTDSATLINAVLYADSLVTPSHNIIYNKNSEVFNPDSVDVDGGLNPIFDGKEPVRASNGYVFAVDNYNYDPSYSFISKLEYPASSRNVAYLSQSTTTSGTTIELTTDNWNDSIDLCGLLDDNTYYYFPVSGSSTMSIFIRLDNVLSGEYKVSIVMLPNRVNINNVQTNTSGEEVNETSTFNACIFDDSGDAITETATNGVNQDSVQKIVLWDSVVFPKCYASLPDEIESFPYLRLQLTRQQQVRGGSKALSIGKIILEPVRE